MRVANPYRPGFNQSPAVLAGREDVVDSLTEAFHAAALDARTPRPIMLVGSRGVGKTVLLAEARRVAAEQHSWISASVEVHPGKPFTPTLLARLRQVEQTYDQAPTDRRRWAVDTVTVKASLAGVGGEAELRRPAVGEPSAHGDLATALGSAMKAALRLDAGLLLTVDERRRRRR